MLKFELLLSGGIMKKILGFFIILLVFSFMLERQITKFRKIHKYKIEGRALHHNRKYYYDLKELKKEKDDNITFIDYHENKDCLLLTKNNEFFFSKKFFLKRKEGNKTIISPKIKFMNITPIQDSEKNKDEIDDDYIYISDKIMERNNIYPNSKSVLFYNLEYGINSIFFTVIPFPHHLEKSTRGYFQISNKNKKLNGKYLRIIKFIRNPNNGIMSFLVERIDGKKDIIEVEENNIKVSEAKKDLYSIFFYKDKLNYVYLKNNNDKIDLVLENDIKTEKFENVIDYGINNLLKNSYVVYSNDSSKILKYWDKEGEIHKLKNIDSISTIKKDVFFAKKQIIKVKEKGFLNFLIDVFIKKEKENLDYRAFIFDDEYNFYPKKKCFPFGEDNKKKQDKLAKYFNSSVSSSYNELPFTLISLGANMVLAKFITNFNNPIFSNHNIPISANEYFILDKNKFYYRSSVSDTSVAIGLFIDSFLNKIINNSSDSNSVLNSLRSGILSFFIIDRKNSFEKNVFEKNFKSFYENDFHLNGFKIDKTEYYKAKLEYLFENKQSKPVKLEPFGKSLIMLFSQGKTQFAFNDIKKKIGKGYLTYYKSEQNILTEYLIEGE